MVPTSIKNIQRYLLCLLLLLVTSIVIFLNNSGLDNYNSINIWIAFIMNVAIVGFSFYFNGIDFITFFLTCANTLLFPILIQYFTGASYGDLSLNLVSLHMPQLLNYNYIYCSVFLFLSVIFNYKRNEYELIKLKFKKRKEFTVAINNLIAIMFTFVAFPRLSFASSANERFAMLLPGHAWNQLVIVALIFNLPYLRTKFTVKLTYLFVICWFLIKGERADVTGLVFGMILYLLIKNSGQTKFKTIIRNVFIFILLFLFLVLLNTIATVRNGQSVTLVEEIKGLLTTPTTTDVGYLYNVAIDYVQSFGILHGQLFKANIISAIPFTSPLGFNAITEAVKYANPGGEPLLAMPIMDYGTWGLFLIATLDFIFFRLFVQYKNTFFKYELVLLLCSVPRMVWYGRSYAYSSILFFVPLVFIIDYIVDKYSK